MELTLLGPPAMGYEPGDTLAGELKYNITSQQETILDVLLHLDGNVFIHTSKLKYEAHRASIALVKESQVPFQGPFTLKQQPLVWPFQFTLPAASIIGDAPIPLPPSMDHHFREGLQIRVEYSITATIRYGSNSSAKQRSKVVLVRPTRDVMAIDGRSYSLSLPAMEFRTSTLPKTLKSTLRGLSGRSRAHSDSPAQILELEITMPSVLSSEQRHTITCSLNDSTGTCGNSRDTTFVLEVLELVLRCRLAWQDMLEDIRNIGIVTHRPGIELIADGQSVRLQDTVGIQDFVDHRETSTPQHSYDSVLPKVSLGYTLIVTAILKHKSSGRRIQTKAAVPVVIVGSIADGLSPPDYERLEATEEGVPPPYEPPSTR
jgi:hypothetical protein